MKLRMCKWCNTELDKKREKESKYNYERRQYHKECAKKARAKSLSRLFWK